MTAILTLTCAFAILVDDFYDASQFLDTLDSFALLNGIEFFQPVRQRERNSYNTPNFRQELNTESCHDYIQASAHFLLRNF